MTPALKTEIRDHVATIWLNRPDVHNAFDDALIAELTAELRRLDGLAEARVIVLAAQGKSFSAGADLNWMKRMAQYSEEENLRDARALANLMRTLHGVGKPTIARVQGAAFGGGVGLVACCDIAVASKEALFCLSEVRLGMIPSVISPYVIAAMGQRAAQRYFLTAERFDADEAKRVGLVQGVVAPNDLDEAVAAMASHLLKGGPAALAAAKKLIADVSRQPIDDALVEETARRIAALRVSPEGREGIAAFLEKRKPDWT
ncbi:MAG TPA: enoyl-CoA hydratase/isomerase family protein [Burkholderiales bacterium]|nr:enoyl-CoA hydratase/isomerase family protein [Burkholderiales bacterium]